MTVGGQRLLRRPGIWFSIAGLTVFAYAVYETATLPFSASVFPVSAGAVGMIAALFSLRREVVGTDPDPTDVAAEGDEKDDGHDLATAGPREFTKLAVITAVFAASIYLLGVLIVAPLLSFAYAFGQKASLRASVLTGLVVYAMLQGVFIRLLNVPLPAGLFGI